MPRRLDARMTLDVLEHEVLCTGAALESDPDAKELADALTRERDGIHAALTQRANERRLPRESPNTFFRVEPRAGAGEPPVETSPATPPAGSPAKASPPGDAPSVRGGVCRVGKRGSARRERPPQRRRHRRRIARGSMRPCSRGGGSGP